MFGKTKKNATDHSHQKFDRKNPGIRMRKGAEAIGQTFGKNSKEYKAALKRCK